MTNPLLDNARSFLRDTVVNTGGLYDMQLVKKNSTDRAVFDPDNPLEPRNSDPASYPCQGTARTLLTRINGTLIKEGESLIRIIGGFLPDNINPEEGDEIIIDGNCYVILEVESSLTAASFLCRTKQK